MRLIYTANLLFDGLPRPYLQMIVDGYLIPAICDTGADTSSIPEEHARPAGIRFGERGTVVGVGGPVAVYRSQGPIGITLAGPRLRRGRIEWVKFDSFMLEPTVIAGARDIPALIGRLDVLVRYRFTLRERDQEFDLTKL